MSFSDDLLVILSSYSDGYRLMRAHMRGYKTYGSYDDVQKISRNTLQVTLSRLKKRGYVINEKKGIWKITEAGKKYFLSKLPKLPKSKKKTPERVKSIIVVFDIPEKKRKMRDWLRAELIGLGFEMLQRSVWFGPAPLPEKFIRTLGDWNIAPHIKFFSAQEADII